MTLTLEHFNPRRLQAGDWLCRLFNGGHPLPAPVNFKVVGVTATPSGRWICLDRAEPGSSKKLSVCANVAAIDFSRWCGKGRQPFRGEDLAEAFEAPRQETQNKKRNHWYDEED